MRVGIFETFYYGAFMTLHDDFAVYVRDLQNRICTEFERLDGGDTFERKPWEKDGTPQAGGSVLLGSGEMRVMRGKVFEKVGVNVSNVHGTFSEKFAAEIPGAAENGGKFRAIGISLVSHMHNPHVPTVHMNVRLIHTSKLWFGGGADLTPTLAYAEDTAHFHAMLKAACDGYEPTAYDAYKKWCDEYFLIKHWNEPRGVGGIFFDNLNSGNVARDFEFVRAVGDGFLPAYSPIVERRAALPHTPEEKEKQYAKRAKYTEFNLLYDRGTRFGFMTGGNPEAILMSLPPTARWP